jgi:hypothetical protein
MIMWMLQKLPQDRPPSGEMLVNAIENVCSTPNDVSRVVRAREAVDRRRKRNELVATGRRAAGFAVGALLLAWLVWEALELSPARDEGVFRLSDTSIHDANGAS